MTAIPKLLTIDETAELIRRTPAQVRWMRFNKSGPRSALLGGRVYFREADVLAWIEQQFARDEP
jgi:predicted DNA-binding transcriptional regulator AlpA